MHYFGIVRKLGQCRASCRNNTSLCNAQDLTCVIKQHMQEAHLCSCFLCVVDSPWIEQVLHHCRYDFRQRHPSPCKGALGQGHTDQVHPRVWVVPHPCQQLPHNLFCFWQCLGDECGSGWLQACGFGGGAAVWLAEPAGAPTHPHLLHYSLPQLPWPQPELASSSSPGMSLCMYALVKVHPGSFIHIFCYDL